MDNKSLVEYKPSLISKVKMFFKSLFGKKEVIPIEEKNANENNNAVNNVKERNFLEDIRVKNVDEINTVNELNRENEREKFLEEIDGNRDALNKLSIEQLKKLDKYYDKIIKENQLKIQNANG